MPLGDFIVGAFFEEFIIEILFRKVIGSILNFVGGATRWLLGSIWRTIFNKPKFKFFEYINGPKNSKDWYDNNHGCVNIATGIMVIGVTIYFLTKII